MIKGSKYTPEQLLARKELAKSRIGVPRSEETKRKIALSKLGVKRPPLSEEWKRKISESGKKSNSGKYVRTPEILEKQSKAQMGKALSPERRVKVTAILIRVNKSRSGEKHHNWKGGITTENEKLRASPEYRFWRKSVFERDKYTCQICQIKGVYVQADHIKPFAFYPELRFELSNGRTLCVPCHRKTETYGYKKRRKTLL